MLLTVQGSTARRGLAEAGFHLLMAYPEKWHKMFAANISLNFFF
jgi:hypothetical protein